MCCGDRHGRNQEYQGMAPAIEPMGQPLSIGTWAAEASGSPECAGLGSAAAPPEESLPSIDNLGFSPSKRNNRSMNGTSSPASRSCSPVPKDIDLRACSFSVRGIPSPLSNAASAQLAACDLSLPPPSFLHGECLVETDSPRGVAGDQHVQRMPLSPRAPGEIAVSPCSVRTESCGDEEPTPANTETSHEALGGPWPWPGALAVGPGIALGTRRYTPPAQNLALLSAEPVIAG